MRQPTSEDARLVPTRARLEPKAMLAALVLVQLADAGTFAVWVWAHGVSGESNPIAVIAYERLGIEGLLLFKGVAILAVIALLVMAAGRFRRVFHMGAATATSIGLLGVLTNIAALLLT